MLNLFDFIGGNVGQWKVKEISTVSGDSLALVPFIEIIPGSTQKSDRGLWALRGVRSNLRYTEKEEEEKLAAVQAGLGRPQATCAALIPILKSAEWWTL